MPVEYRIHPAIGVARVGDSLEEFFIGPEAPGVRPTMTKPDGPALAGGQRGTYKDSKSCVKRQGARFRIYQVHVQQCGRHYVGARNHRRRRADRMGSTPGEPEGRGGAPP